MAPEAVEAPEAIEVTDAAETVESKEDEAGGASGRVMRLRVGERARRPSDASFHASLPA
ncbi:hypothetical protein [Burkholderia gladioli]|uniref:hypothetical protein n=1 Tax=Burkholderia gladioli TaxID=28095 RepID=UPI001FC806AA|nr:hypothetical protein [Burkholderia gladioli]